MPIDFSTPEGATTPQNDGSIFAPTPIWEQRSKARRRGRRAARIPLTESRPASATATDPDTASENEGFHYDPIRSERRRSGVPAAVIAGGVAAIAVIAALGWYMNRPADRGMPELTPGATGTGDMAIAAAPVNPLPMSAAGAPMGVTPQMDATSPPREAAPAPTARSGERVTSGPEADRSERSSRVRPAAPSAQDEGVDASAAAPMINPPAPAGGAKGPTLNMPPEEIAPQLDPALPSNSGARAPSVSAPVAGDVTTP